MGYLHLEDALAAPIYPQETKLFAALQNNGNVQQRNYKQNLVVDSSATLSNLIKGKRMKGKSH